MQLLTLLAQEYDWEYSADTAELSGGAATAVAGVFVFVWAAIILVSLVGLILWIWALVDLMKRDFTNPSDKTTWLVVMIVGFILGLTLIAAIVYLVWGRKKGTMTGSAPKTSSENESQPSSEDQGQ